MSSSDKELLTLAAKAAGITFFKYVENVTDYDSDHYGGPAIQISHSAETWNPLTDDGDALRLAVKLGMRLNLPTQTYAYVGANDQLEYCKNEDYYAATRRAIVRAAAQIGRTYDRQSA